MSLAYIYDPLYNRAPLFPRRIGEQHFGLGFSPNDVLSTTVLPRVLNDYYRTWCIRNPDFDLGSNIKVDDTKLQISLDVQHFTPEEVTVKVVDGYIVVEGKHEEKKDEHGYISRQFVRRYALPEGTQPETVESKLSADGVLSVTAPKKVPESIKGERKVPITQTGPVLKGIKDRIEVTQETNK